MAATYVPIASNTLTTSAASVTFSSIPATYTDLVLKWSARSNDSGNSELLLVSLDGTTSGTSQSNIELQGTGSSAVSFSNPNRANMLAAVTGNNATANTFSSGELYIPNYAGSTNKPASIFSANENNTTNAVIQVLAGLLRSTSVISSIRLAPSSTTFLTGSSFFLYGIKNS